MPHTRTAVFADVQNIYYTTRDAYGRAFDYRKLWQIVSSQGPITHAFAYAIDRGDAQQQKFQSALRHIGFEVKLKPLIKRADGSAKGDWDVGITIDIMDTAPHVDRVVLLSGDGDFELLMDKIRADYNVYAEVYGVSTLTANALIDSADAYHPIDYNLLV